MDVYRYRCTHTNGINDIGVVRIKLKLEGQRSNCILMFFVHFFQLLQARWHIVVTLWSVCERSVRNFTLPLWDWVFRKEMGTRNRE